SKDKLLFFADFVFRSITNESFLKTNFLHHIVTLINTGRTVHTLQLSSVSDIYPRRANRYTQLTVYTISVARRFSVYFLINTCSPGFFFSSFVFISYNYRFVVQKQSLYSSISTCNNTNLLPLPYKH